MMSFTLGSSGHEVASVSTLDEAQKLLGAFPADAIVYDWDTRGGPLLGLGRTIRTEVRTIRAVVVVSSRDEPAGFCNAEAIDAYFTKPCAMREVVAKLEKLVRTART